MSHNVLKRKTLKQGSVAYFRAGVPDCGGRAGLVKGFLLRLQDIPGLGGGGLQVRLGGKGGKRSFTALCFSLLFSPNGLELPVWVRIPESMIQD